MMSCNSLAGAGTSGQSAWVDAMRQANEVSAILIGRCTSDGWIGRLTQKQAGEASSVRFDWAWVLAREEGWGDVIGFYHTHPGGLISPSQRDMRTMRAWVSCFGKPLLCLVESNSSLAAYLFETDEDNGRPVSGVHRSGDEISVTHS